MEQGRHLTAAAAGSGQLPRLKARPETVLRWRKVANRWRLADNVGVTTLEYPLGMISVRHETQVVAATMRTACRRVTC